MRIQTYRIKVEKEQPFCHDTRYQPNASSLQKSEGNWQGDSMEGSGVEKKRGKERMGRTDKRKERRRKRLATS